MSVHTAAAQQYMTSELHHRLLARNTSMFSLSGFREQRFLDTMCPKMLKARSDAVLEVQMHTFGYFARTFCLSEKQH